MTSTAKALYKFFSGFGIPAYDENAVPDSAELPYITYQLVEPRWDDTASITAMVYYKDTSYVAINAMIDKIKAAFPKDGCLRIPAGNGSIHLFIDSNFAQEQPNDSDTIKAIQLLFGLHALCD